MDNTFGPPPGDDDFTVDTTPKQPKIEMADGVYRLRLAEIRTEDNPFDGAKKRRVWEFQPQVDGQWKDGKLFFYTSLGAGPRIQEALTALKVPFDKNGKTTLKKSEIVGRECSGLVQNVEGQKGGKFPRLKALLAA
jgi:hypothetical protein